MKQPASWNDIKSAFVYRLLLTIAILLSASMELQRAFKLQLAQIEEQKQQLEYLANYDPLTKLPSLRLSDVLGRDKVELICQRILDSLNSEFLVADRALYIGLSIGVSVFPEHGDSFSTLRREADKAMYAVKKQTKNGFAFAMM